MADQKKQSFLHGAALLALATAIVKVIGALYKIPLNAILGTKGFAYFNTAYDIYSVLMMISTAGLPVAMSRMISAASSLDNHKQMRRIYKTAQFLFLSICLPGALLMTLFARELAQFQQQPDAWAAIAALGPSVLMVGFISAFRGFFQGQGNMIPTSVSQVMESTAKLVVGLAAAALLLNMTGQVSMAAGGAIFGVTSGCTVAAVYLFFLFRKAYQSLEKDKGEEKSYGATAKELLAIAIPITIGSAGLQIITLLEVKVYMTQLLATGFTQDAADSMKGVYNMAQTIFNMPCAFINPITVSAIPAITSALTLHKHSAVRATEESASRITALISMPCAFGLATLAEPIMALLGGYTGEELVLATRLMQILGFCVIFNSTVLLTNGIMQAHGNVVLPVVNMFIGGGLKLVSIYMLTGNPNMNIIGVPIGTVLCYLVITVLNLLAMNRSIQEPPHMIRNMLRPALSGGIMALAVMAAHFGLSQVFTLGSTLGKLILCAVPVLVGVVVYVVCVVIFKAITREDCMLLPKGEKIAKLLRL